MAMKNKKINKLTVQELQVKLSGFKKRGDFDSRYYLALKAEYNRRIHKHAVI